MPSRIFRDGLLAGRRAVVTGGGTGIGRATALELADLGADIALFGRRPEPLEAVASEIRAMGRRAVSVPTDLREPEQVKAGVALARETLGGLDVLVNNAGGHFVQPAEDLSLKGWNAVVNNNLNATFYVTQEVARQAMLPERRGVIVNLVIDMWHGAPGAAHAGAARAAVENLTKTLAVEWAQHGVRVNAVAPGTTESAALQVYPEPVVRALRSVVPLGRLGRPEEIAWLIAYLVSDAADWISGETVCIDGGSRLWGGIWNVFSGTRK